MWLAGTILMEVAATKRLPRNWNPKSVGLNTASFLRQFKHDIAILPTSSEVISAFICDDALAYVPGRKILPWREARMLVWHGSSRFKSPNKESLRDAMYTLAGKTKALVLHSRELAFSSQPELLPTCQRQYDFNGGKHLPLKLVIALQFHLPTKQIVRWAPSIWSKHFV